MVVHRVKRFGLIEMQEKKGFSIKTVIIALIKFYQKTISPLFPSTCIYTPTCSHYAIEAIQKYGILKGGSKAALRVLRCTPFHKGGYDPVK